MVTAGQGGIVDKKIKDNILREKAKNQARLLNSHITKY